MGHTVSADKKIVALNYLPCDNESNVCYYRQSNECRLSSILADILISYVASIVHGEWESLTTYERYRFHVFENILTFNHGIVGSNLVKCYQYIISRNKGKTGRAVPCWSRLLMILMNIWMHISECLLIISGGNIYSV